MAKTLTPTPRIWALLDNRPGHQTQVEGLASALGLPYETKTLAFNRLNELPNPLLGRTLWSVDRGASDHLAPPWPDIVIAMGRRCLPVARWIRRQSGERSKLVHIGRKGVTAADEFALLISCAHFNMPPHEHRLAVTLPPTQVTDAKIAEARMAWPDLLSDMAAPRIVLLVGGDTVLHDFPANVARDLLTRAETATEALGGSLTVVTSRRTSRQAIEAMQAAAGHAVFHLWDGQQKANPYLGYLAWADALIVTGESESMLAEAASTGKPLMIAPLPGRPLGAMKRLRQQMTAIAFRPEGALASLCRALFNQGWMTPSRDLEKMHALMYEAGLARPFGAELYLGPPAENRAAEPFVARVMDLLGHPRQPTALP